MITVFYGYPPGFPLCDTNWDQHLFVQPLPTHLQYITMHMGRAVDVCIGD